MAVADRHAALGVGERFGKALGRHEMQLPAVRGGHADRARVGVELPDRALQEAATHVVHRLRTVQERGRFVERRQLAVLRCKLRGLLLHARFQARVGFLQFVRHPVEAAREIAEFVARVHRQARAELARRDAREPVAQPDHGQDDPQVEQVDRGDGARAREHAEPRLRQPQERRLACVVALDLADEPVGVVDERGERVRVGRAQRIRGGGTGRGRGQRFQPGRPARRDRVELPPDRFGGGQEQRTRRIAAPQPRERAVDRGEFAVEGLRAAGAPVLVEIDVDARRAHPQAARVVDRGARALELPRQPQRAADHREHERERARRQRDDAGRQAMAQRRAGRVVGRLHGGRNGWGIRSIIGRARTRRLRHGGA